MGCIYSLFSNSSVEDVEVTTIARRYSGRYQSKRSSSYSNANRNQHGNADYEDSAKRDERQRKLPASEREHPVNFEDHLRNDEGMLNDENTLHTDDTYDVRGNETKDNSETACQFQPRRHLENEEDGHNAGSDTCKSEECISSSEIELDQVNVSISLETCVTHKREERSLDINNGSQPDNCHKQDQQETSKSTSNVDAYKTFDPSTNISGNVVFTDATKRHADFPKTLINLDTRLESKSDAIQTSTTCNGNANNIEMEQKQFNVDVEQKQLNNEVEQKQRSIEVEQKQPSNEMEQKQPNNEMEQKQPSNEMEQKQPSNEVEQKLPSNEVEPKQPNNEVEQEQPSNEVEQKSPSNEVEPKQPNNEVEQKQIDMNMEQISFEVIDAHARMAPHGARNSVTSLVEYMRSGTYKDRYLVRGFFVWITENIRYDVNGYFGRTGTASSDVCSVMKTGLSVCEGYTRVMDELCRTAGIQCKMISRYSKGLSYRADIPITTADKTDHAWNAVSINGEWHLLDSTWGTGYVDSSQQFVKEFNEYYFLTDPDEFINGHFPYRDLNMEESMKWQLLKTPISLEKFSKMVRRQPESFNLKVIPESHKEGHIQMSDEIELVFRSEGRGNLKYMATLSYILCNETWTKERQEHSTSINAIGITCIVKVHPRKIGKYVLGIYAKEGSADGIYQEIMSYSLHCNEIKDPDFEFILVHPSNADAPTLIPESHVGGRIDMKEEIELVFRCKDHRELNCTASLYHIKNTDTSNEVEEEYSTLTYVANGVCRVKIHPRKVGRYDLTVFAKHDSDEGTYIPILTYRIHCTDVKDPDSYMTDEIELVFRCKDDRALNYMASLYHIQNTARGRAENEEYSTLTKVANGVCRVKIHPRKVGRYELTVFAKHGSDEGTYVSILTYRIHCTEVKDPDFEFIQMYDRNADALKLIPESHKNGLIYMTNVIELMFSCKGKRKLNCMASLQHRPDNDANNREEVKNSTFTWIVDDVCIVKVHPRKVGKYMLTIFGKEGLCKGRYSSILSYRINCREIKDAAFVFPDVYASEYTDRCAIIQPQNGRLPVNKEATFDIYAPHLKSISIGNVNLTLMGKHFLGKIKTGSKGSKHIVYAVHENGHQLYRTGMFEYHVV